MAHLLTGNNANDLWVKALQIINKAGKESTDTKEILHVVLELSNPRQKWVIARSPVISVAFALAELIWILSGDNRRDIIDFWNPSYQRFAADEGSNIYYGAYGYRLKVNHGIDQLFEAYSALKNNPNNRQTVLLYWDPQKDFPREGQRQSRDIPCNICSLLKIRENKLEWTQIMRSNDIIMGLPYNFIQFTSLQEILAGWLNVEIGNYIHYSDSLHFYERDKSFNFIEKAIKNEDSLSISKHESDIIIKEIYSRMIKIVEGDTSLNSIKKHANLSSRYEAYNNITRVIVAYAANKLGYINIINDIMGDCTNPMYKELFEMYLRKKD